MTVDELGRAVEQAVRPEVSRWGLDPERFSARYVPNAGGFVNHSFRLDDGGARVHLKLAGPDNAADLDRWFRVHRILSDRYHAPRALARVDLRALELSGIAFEHVEGRVPGHWDEVPGVEVARMLAELHADRELARELEGGTGRSFAEVFLATYADRYREDLGGIGQTPPPFVSSERLDWLVEESRRLTGAIVREPAFAGAASAPTHGDVWLENVLTTDDGWFLLDWDELGPGDPAMDLGMLGGPIPADLARREDFAELELTDAERVRIRWYRRAALLDWTIDTLADWCEAERWLTDPAPFRARNRDLHQRAYTTYRNLYPFGV